MGALIGRSKPIEGLLEELFGHGNPHEAAEAGDFVQLPPPPSTFDPIKIPDKPYSSRDLMVQQRAWAERLMLKPFKEHLVGDEPWAQEASSFVQEAVAEWAEDPVMEFARLTNSVLQPTPQDREAALARRGMALLKNGCDDPLVRFLTNHLRYRLRDYTGLPQSAGIAFSDLISSPVYPRAVAFLAGLYADIIFKKTNLPQSLTEVDRRIPDLAIQSLKAGDYSGEDDFLFLFHTELFEEYLTREYEAFGKVCETAELPEWERNTLLGELDLKRAQEGISRGADSGKPLQNAREELTRAWKMRPDRPEAATAMIGVSMVGHTDPKEVRLWFDQATAAQINYFPAYRNVIRAFHPSRGGSREAILAFGNACADTQRYDLRLPRFFLRAVESVVEESENWRELYRDPKIGPKIMEVYKGLADEKTWPEGWRSFTGFLAINAYMAGDGKTAAEAFQKINNQLTEEHKEYLRNYRLSLTEIFKELPALSAPNAKAYQRALDLFYEKKNVEAIAAFEALTKDESPAIAENARTRLEALKMDKQSESGEWVKVSPEGWSNIGEKWEVTSEGLLEPRETGKQTALIAPPRLGDCFELRLDLDYSPPTKPDGNVFAVMLGFTGEENHFFNFGIWRAPNQTLGSIYDSWDYFSENRNIRMPIEGKNRFWIQAWQGNLTYYFNGRKIADVKANSGIVGDWSQAHFGVYCMDARWGAMYRVGNVYVRKLNNPPTPPAPRELSPQ